MLKKAGFVAATAAGLTMLGGTAFAAEGEDTARVADQEEGKVTYEEAYQDFIHGGAAAGYGAASLVAAAYTGISLTPDNVTENFQDNDNVGTGSFSGVLPNG